MVLHRRHVSLRNTHPLTGSTVMPTGLPTPRAVPSLVISVFLYLTSPWSFKTYSTKSLIRTEFHKGKQRKLRWRRTYTHKFQSPIRDEWEGLCKIWIIPNCISGLWGNQLNRKWVRKAKSALKFLLNSPQVSERIYMDKRRIQTVNIQTHYLRETTKTSSEKDMGENSGRQMGAP